jgi:PTH1 family peptidyl-tRNA hydrolase
LIPLLVGLGNPGPKYARTRHNAGFLFLDQFADACEAKRDGLSGRLSPWKEKFGGMAAELRDFRSDNIEIEMIVLFKPLSFMNLSGRPVKAVADHYRCPASSWLILHDEIDLPFADIRPKEGGGHRGHNGLRDIMAICGTGDFSRLRIGVGRPDNGSVADYVLSPFAKEELASFVEVSAIVNRLVREWLLRKVRT